MIFLYVVLAFVFLIAWVAAFGWLKDEDIFPSMKTSAWADGFRFTITPVVIFCLLIYGITTKVLDAFCGDV